MKTIPVLTEKSLSLVKQGKYTFWVEVGLNKNEIRKMIEKVYEVHVTGIRTIRYKGGTRKNIRGRKVRFPGRKKAIVVLKKDEKIDAFETEKGKKK